jgi:hypothetical protein
MADKVKTVKAVKANGKQFETKKVGRFDINECKIEMDRLKAHNQTTSLYFKHVKERHDKIS